MFINDKTDLEILNKSINLLTRFSLLMIYFSDKTGATNSFITNLILYINLFLGHLDMPSNISELNNEYCVKSLVFRNLMIGSLILLSKNTSSTNTTLLNQIELSLYKLNELFSNKEEMLTLLNTSSSNDSSSDYSLICLFNNFNSKGFIDSFQQERLVFIMSFYLQIAKGLLSYIEFNKDDINFEILFKNSVSYISSIQRILKQYDTIHKNKLVKKIGMINLKEY